MNFLLQPVSTIMTSNLITVNPGDTLDKVAEVFKNNKIHHLPVVRYQDIVGLVSKSDLLLFLRGMGHDDVVFQKLNEIRLSKYKVEDIMTTGLAKVSSDTRINVVLEVLKENLFHAIPVVDNGKLSGIVTTYDIIRTLASFSTVEVPAAATV